MAEPNNHELNEKISDIREWLVRIDTKVDFLNEVKTTADRAEQKADKALMKSDDNAADITASEERTNKRIDGIQTTSRWAIGLTATTVVTVVGIIIAAF